MLACNTISKVSEQPSEGIAACSCCLHPLLEVRSQGQQWEQLRAERPPLGTSASREICRQGKARGISHQSERILHSSSVTSCKKQEEVALVPSLSTKVEVKPLPFAGGSAPCEHLSSGFSALQGTAPRSGRPSAGDQGEQRLRGKTRDCSESHE